MKFCITATQMIVHHSVSVIPIYKSFKTEDIRIKTRIVPVKNFKIIASVLYVVGMTK